MNKIKLIVKDTQNCRLDLFLSKNKIYKSRSIAAKYCENQKVFVNGKVVSKKQLVNDGDIIEYEEMFENDELEKQDIPLNIKYEDSDILVISKQAGLICHPTNTVHSNTLVNALLFHCGKETLYDNGVDKNRYGIVHRLDKDTSGLLIIAKSKQAGEVLTRAMKDHSTSRHYKCLVYGNIKPDTGMIDVPLYKSINKGPKNKPSNNPNAKQAKTSFKVLERINSKFGKFTLLDCKIHTGRTHQIRSHMEYINHPVVGDKLYNSNKPKEIDPISQLNLNRQFLHSWNVSFNHPITGKLMQFHDNLPKDLLYSYNLIKENSL